MELVAIGTVESELVDLKQAPKQGNEGAPDAWLAFSDEVVPGLEGLQVGDELFVLTWLHRSRRDVLRTRPHSDPANPERGVFGTRSPERPNPIGLHRVRVVEIDNQRFRVRNPEALDGTPIIDVKPVIAADERPV